MPPSPWPEIVLRDADYRDPDEAREALQLRTSRVSRITARHRLFKLRYRSVEIDGLHVSRTWETNAEFSINGQVVPVMFFPAAGGTVLTTRGGEQRFTAASVGGFTVAEEARFSPAKGYSEIVLRLDRSALREAMNLLDIDVDVDAALRVAALRTDLAGLDRLRAKVFGFFDDCTTEPEPFRSRNARLQQEAITLRAASLLSVALGLKEPADHGAHPALGRAIEFIRTRLNDDIGFRDIAQASGVSLRLLQALFRRDLGCTPGQFIRTERLRHARTLLDTGAAASVTQAALDSGFHHLGKFSAAYRQSFGESPSQTLRRWS